MAILLLTTLFLPLGRRFAAGRRASGGAAVRAGGCRGRVRHGRRVGGLLSGRGSRRSPRPIFAWLDWCGATVDIRFSVALDGLSLWLFGLTALLMVVAVLVGWEAIDEQASLYYRLLLILETGMLGVFVARDIILFYVFFEFTLIPLFFLIGIWGSEERRYAAIKFFLFTLGRQRADVPGAAGDRDLGLLRIRSAIRPRGD